MAVEQQPVGGLVAGNVVKEQARVGQSVTEQAGLDERQPCGRGGMMVDLLSVSEVAAPGG
ncbi:hypothetical protein [Kitasatospora sp. NPDC089509]|uniref:hypothetical protein n=1 Tax=Kitasatospora sp. NPDC089509 TaxID=3364079 RepID=UPI003816EF6B